MLVFAASATLAFRVSLFRSHNLHTHTRFRQLDTRNKKSDKITCRPHTESEQINRVIFPLYLEQMMAWHRERAR